MVWLFFTIYFNKSIDFLCQNTSTFRLLMAIIFVRDLFGIVIIVLPITLCFTLFAIHLILQKPSSEVHTEAGLFSLSV